MHVDNNKTFTLAWNAMCSFMSAQSLVKIIQQLNLAQHDPRTIALFGAIAGYYAVPFMSSNRLGQLPKSIVPSAYKVRHKDLMTLRNKVFLHLDSGVNFDGRKDVTNVRVTIAQNSDDVKIEAKSWTPKPTTLAEIAALLEHLIQELHENAMQYVRKRLPRTCVAPGAYRLKIDGDQFELEPDT